MRLAKSAVAVFLCVLLAAMLLAGCRPAQAAESYNMPRGIVVSGAEELMEELLTRYKSGKKYNDLLDVSLDAASVAADLEEWRSCGDNWAVNKQAELYEKYFSAQHQLAEGEEFVNIMGREGMSATVRGAGTLVAAFDSSRGMYRVIFFTFDPNGSLMPEGADIL